MNTKCVFFFLVAVCLTQCFEARRTVISPRSINDIIKNIEEVIKDVENALSELINQIPEILKTLEDKIKEAINSVDIDKILEDIQNQVDEILKKLNVDPSTVHECIDNEEAAVKQLVQDTTQGLANCKQDADDEISELNKAMEDLKNKADKLKDDSIATVKQCVDENGANLIKVAECLKEHLEVIKTEAVQLIGQIMETIKLAKEKSTQVPLELAKCVGGVQGEAIFKQKDIIDEFTKCVEAHTQE